MYGVTTDSEISDAELYKVYMAIQSDKKIDLEELKQSAYIYRDSTAVHHLISVASSLDSLVVGETQITGQFKKSINLSKESNTLGTVLDRLSQHALGCSKKIRRNTAIGEKTVSISHTAVDLAKKIFGDISEQRVLIVGAGEMSRLAYQYSASYKPKELSVVNRTYDNAKQLATEVGYGSPYSMDELENRMVEADIIISCTGSDEHIISKKLLERVQKTRKRKSIFLCDIAIPRDIDPACGDLDEVFLFEVDDLQQIVNENLEERRLAAKEAKTYVDQTTKTFMEWVETLDLKGVLGDIKTNIDALLAQESSKTFKKDIFSNLTKEQSEAISMLQASISSKIIGQIAISVSQTEDNNEKNELLKALKKSINRYIDNHFTEFKRAIYDNQLHNSILRITACNVAGKARAKPIKGSKCYL